MCYYSWLVVGHRVVFPVFGMSISNKEEEMDFLDFEKDLDSPPDNTNKDDPDSDGDSFSGELKQLLELEDNP